MAQSDRKRYRGRSGGGSYNWDAQERRQSKAAYDQLNQYEDVKAALDALGDDEFLRTIEILSGISRYGSTDLERIYGSLNQGDIDAIKERKRNVAEHQHSEQEKRYEASQARRVAEQTVEANQYRQSAALAAGMLRSDCHDVYELREKTGQYYGDWIDDPVALLTGGDGWGRNVKEQAGVKLQITLSLDASNSMWHNGIAADAVKAFIELGMALDELVQTFPGSVYANQFLFAMTEDGKWVNTLDAMDHSKWQDPTPNAGAKMGKYDSVRDWVHSIPYRAGNDTWIAPLFEAIESWENESSDPGCVRLDLILTDAVLEHPIDVRDAGKVQERRDGSLQTVLLNFLPEEEWLDSALPMHCVQYPANGANVAGLLRKLLAEFVSVYY